MTATPFAEGIQAILFEPVGCLAEFPPEPFQEIAARLFQRRKQPSKSGSRVYWRLLNSMEASFASSIAAPAVEALELESVEAAMLYEDARPALVELRSMGVRALVVSSLCDAALRRFLDKCGLDEFFESVHSRDSSGGIKAAPLKAALAAANLIPRRTVFLTDTAAGLELARSLEVNPVLMMNDPDEAKRLALRNPAGGIVSLHELCDMIRVVSAKRRLVETDAGANVYKCT